MSVTRMHHSLASQHRKTVRNDEENVGAGLQNFTKIRVGYCGEEPFSFVDPNTKKITGESWEICCHVLEEMGVTFVDPVQTEFWSLIPKLKSKYFDIIAAGLTITPQRVKEGVEFSYPTYRNREGLVVQNGNPKGLKTWWDVVRHSTARIATIFGSAAEAQMRIHHVPPERIVPFQDGSTALKAVVAGQADAFIGSVITIYDHLVRMKPIPLEPVKEFKGILVQNMPLEEFGAFAFRPEDRALKNAFNAILKPFVGTEAHLKMVRPFGFSYASVPRMVPADILSAVT